MQEIVFLENRIYSGPPLLQKLITYPTHTRPLNMVANFTMFVALMYAAYPTCGTNR